MTICPRCKHDAKPIMVGQHKDRPAHYCFDCDLVIVNDPPRDPSPQDEHPTALTLPIADYPRSSADRREQQDSPEGDPAA